MYLLNEDTICAPATVPGTGAISVVRVSGPEALHAVSAIVGCAHGRDVASAPGYSVRYGQIRMQDGELLDDVLVSVFRAPHSYTGEDSAEISCHASRYIVDNIMLLLAGQGVRAAAPGEFTRRAFLNGKMDLAQAEAVADLIAAENSAAHRVALSQLKGGFSKELKNMRDRLLNIVSLMELELDFSEEDVEFADRSELSGLVDGVIAHIDRLVSSFRLGNAIKNGIPVAIAGATNTGKSTLLNALLGEERAIVSDVHGTTRDTIEETLNIGGLMFRFIDTAGIRKTDETVEQIGIERTFWKVGEAAVVIVMLDAGRIASDCNYNDCSVRSSRMDVPFYSGKDIYVGPTTEDGGFSRVLSDVLGRINPKEQKVIFVLNKIDLFESLSMPCVSECGDAVAVGFESEPSVSGTCGPAGFPGDTSGTEASNETSSGTSRSDQSSSDDCHKSGKSRVGSEGREVSSEELSRKCYLPDSSGKFRPLLVGNKNVLLLNQIVSLINNQCDNYDIKDAALVFLSAKTGEGIDALKSALSGLCPEYSAVSDGVMVTNMRHIEALTNASSALLRVRSGLSSGLPGDLVSQDIREALYHLGSIVGEISTDEVLGNIFKNFCIGK